jgi:hypothetical protein
VSESAANLPPDKVIAACKAYFAGIREQADNEFSEGVQKFLNAPFVGAKPTHDEAIRHNWGSPEGFLDANYGLSIISVRGLLQLSEAAAKAGETRVRVSSNDFLLIAAWYRA